MQTHANSNKVVLKHQSYPLHHWKMSGKVTARKLMRTVHHLQSQLAVALEYEGRKIDVAQMCLQRNSYVICLLEVLLDPDWPMAYTRIHKAAGCYAYYTMELGCHGLLPLHRILVDREKHANEFLQIVRSLADFIGDREARGRYMLEFERYMRAVRRGPAVACAEHPLMVLREQVMHVREAGVVAVDIAAVTALGEGYGGVRLFHQHLARLRENPKFASRVQALEAIERQSKRLLKEGWLAWDFVQVWRLLTTLFESGL